MFARLAKGLNPCAGAFALRTFKDANPGELTQSALDMQTGLYLDGDCGKLRGKGAAQIKLNQSAPVTEVQVTVNDTKATFYVDRRSGYTLIGRAFADKLGIRATGPEILTYGVSSLKSARLAVLDSLRVQTAVAGRVQVAVVGGLPQGIHGVLGRSFFWRFAVRATFDSITLAPR